MKLIDLDKALAEAEDECRMSDDWKVAHEMMNVFKYQPIINAIPVEWIKKWEQKEENYYLYKDLTRKLIEDWEKENGRS